MYRCLYLTWVFAWGAACAADPPGPEAPVVHVRFDLSAKVMPTPNDIVRDAARGRLDLPAEPADLEGKTAAEIALIQAFNTRDGWPTRMEAKLELSGPIAPASLTPEAVRVFERGPDGVRAVEVRVRAEPVAAPTTVIIAPPDAGWARGRSHFVVVRGGARGLVGAGGEPVVADSSFWFLRARADLRAHVDALPGATPADKLAAAERLEGIRSALAPDLAHVEALGVPRTEVAALWQFTPTAAPEVWMDKALGEMPLPSDFLRDPVSGRVDLPPRDGDSALALRTKRDLAGYDGFALSADLWFDTTAPLDPRTVTATTVRLFALEAASSPSGVARAVPVPVRVEAKQGDTRVVLSLLGAPLTPGIEHVVVLSRAVKDSRGQVVAPMLPGLLTRLEAPIFDGTRSLIASVDGESAARAEPVRRALVRALASVAAEVAPEDVAVAWPFRTMRVVEPLLAARDAARTLPLPRDPADVTRASGVQAALDFPLSALTLLRVDRVYQGTITTADFLDPLTRRRRDDGAWEPRPVRFTLTVPRGLREGEPLKVAIFGHGLMTERRFVLALADALAGAGFAAIAIDLPFHGERSHCRWNGPACLVNPLDQAGDPICPDPCRRGDTCAPDGRCVDSAGQPQPLAEWPLVNFAQASGAAFLDVDDMVGTRDHFYQGLTDLSALVVSLQRGNWQRAVGHPIAPELVYAGQSLGGIFGALFVATHPEIQRAVLNVPGADLIDMFRESTLFRPHFEALLAREGITAGTPEHDRLLNVARWVMDAVDPQSFAPYLAQRSIDAPGTPLMRTLLIQMASLDLIIPNTYTRRLADLSGVPLESYLAEHGFIVVPVEPAYLPGVIDLVRVLEQGRLP